MPTHSTHTPLPKDYGDHAGLLAFAQDFLRKSQSARFAYEWQQYRNCLFYLGIQWLIFDGVLRTLIPTPTHKAVPKPVTNKYAAVLRPIISQLAAEEPNVYLAPMTDKAKDIDASRAGSRALEIAYRETNLRYLRPTMARWMTLTGNVFLISGYDTSDASGTIFVQNYMCPECLKDAAPADIENAGGACPMCQQMNGNFTPSMDQTGKPRGTNYPRGRLFSDIAPVFEMYFDWQAQRIEDSMVIARRRSVSHAYLLRHFGKKAEGARGTPLLTSAPPYFMEALAYASAHSDAAPWYAGTGEYDRAELVDLWIDHPNYPQGFIASIADGKVLLAGPSPYHTLDSAPDQPRPLRSLVHLGYEVAPGRVWYKSPADDLAPKQMTRNRIEASIELHMRRAANTVWVAPEGAHTTPVSGEIGVVLRYTPMAGAQPPSRQPGAELPTSVWKYLERIDTEMEDLAGSSDVLRGQAPPRVTAYQALQLLEQRGQLALAEPVVNWSLGHQKWAEQTLAIFREHAVDDRFVTAMGDNGRWAVSSLTGLDLRGGVRVEVEAGLGRPRSWVAKRAVIEQGVRLGVINVLDPQERFKVIQILGIDELAKDYDIDRQAAARENDVYVDLAPQAMGNPMAAQMLPWPNVRTAIDNHIVHLHTHRRFAVSEAFRDLPPLVQEVFFLHTEAHAAAIQQMYGQVAGQGAPMGRPAAPNAMTGQGVDTSTALLGMEDHSVRPGMPQIGLADLAGGGVPESVGAVMPR